jgi:3-oxoacyl-[acyl-carrier protein] reductase
MTLNGRVAVITGASQGIGRACALELAKSGAAVALMARNKQKLTSSLTTLESRATSSSCA